MRFSLALAACTLAFTSEALATVTTKSFVTCFTRYGPKSQSPVKTTSAILTIPFYGYTITTITPLSTITPKAVTTTVSTTITATATTTLPQETDTFSSTSTELTTTTVTLTSSSSTRVAAFTTITTTPTTTVAASAGFIPIKTSIPNSMKRRNAAAVEAPVAAPLEERQTKKQILFKGGKPVFSPAAYPTAVTCAGIAKVITYTTKTATAKTKTVTAGTPTSSVTTTFSTTITQTVSSVDASTTLSFSTTLTVTATTTTSTTSTFTATTTVEVAAPSATFYAACDSNNMISYIGGKAINGASVNGDSTTVTVNSAYDCCVACLNTPNCGGSLFFAEDFCALDLPNGVCSQSNTAFTLVNIPSVADIGVASNGYCGQAKT